MKKNIVLSFSGVTKFDWSLILADSIYVITIKMFDSVASGTPITIEFTEPSYIVDLSGNEMNKDSVKVYLPTGFSYNLQQAVTTTVTTASSVAATTGALGGASAAMSGGAVNLQALWGMVEMMQITNYLVFLSAKYPENVKTFLSALNIANMAFLPNPFQKYGVTEDPFPDPPKSFVDEGFNTDFIMNTGQFILIWMIVIAIFPVSVILYHYIPRFKIIRSLKNMYEYSIFFRLGIESFLEISMAVFLQFRQIVTPDYKSGYASIVLSFVTLFYLVLTYVLVVWKVTFASQEIIKKEAYEKKYGTLFEGFRKDSKISVSFLLFQHTRRIIFAVLCAYLYEYTTVQVALSTLLSFSYTLALILIRPFEKNILGNALHISSEVLFFSAHCIILKFLDKELSDDERDNLGWAVISLLSLSLILHLIANLIIQVISIIASVKSIRDWCIKRGGRISRVYKKRGMLDTIILDRKIVPKNKGKELDNNGENMAYFDGKKKTIIEGGFSFRESKLSSNTEEKSDIQETMGDETYNRIDTSAISEHDESFTALKKRKNKP